MSTSAASQLDILISVSARLDELQRTTNALKQSKEEAKGFGEALKFGAGIELARRGLDLFANALRSSFGEALRFGREIKNNAEALDLTTESLQVLADLVEDTGGDMGSLTQAINKQRLASAEWRNETSAAAAALRTLGINADEFNKLPTEQRLAAIGRGMAMSTDRTAAYDAASQILGARTLPRLTNALRVLGADGYAKVAQEAKDAGKVMDEFAIQRLTEADLYIKDVKQKMTVMAGETIGFYSLLGGALSDDFAGTVGAWLDGSFWDKLATYMKTVPPNEKPPGGGEALEKFKTEVAVKNVLIDQLQREQQLVENDPSVLASEKRQVQVDLIKDEIKARADLIALISNAPSEAYESPAALQARIALLRDENRAASNRIIELQGLVGAAPGGGGGTAGFGMRLRKSAFENISDNFNNRNTRAGNPNSMSAGQGMMGGMMSWVTSLGSVGEQTASSLQSSIGSTVDGISNGIYGWVTGTETWGNSLRQIGSSIFQTMLNTIIQMGVQWLVTQALVQTGLISTHVVGEGLRAQRIAGAVAEGTATTAAHAPGAAAASISSFGAAAAIGIAALIAVMAAFGGFAEGGYTGAGGKYQPAGIVHRGEYVMDAATTSRLGVGTLDALRFNGTARGGSAAAGALGGGGRLAPESGSRERTIIIADSAAMAARIQREPGYENNVVDIMDRRRGEIMAK